METALDRRGMRKERLRLTGREAEVLLLIAEGLSSAEIAESLFLSKRTVDFHLANAYKRLQVANRIQAIRVAERYGLMPSTPKMSIAFNFPDHPEVERLSHDPEPQETSRERMGICPMQEGLHDDI